MSKNFKNFVNYLFDIGIVGINSIKIFLTLYNSSQNKQINNEILVKILYDYFNNLESKDIQIICTDIINRYQQQKFIEQNKASKLIFNLYKRQETQKVKDCFKNFKEKLEKIKSLKSLNSSKSIGKNKFLGSNLMYKEKSLFHNASEDYLFQEKKATQTTKEKLMDEEKKECTFKPQINSYKSLILNDYRNNDTFTRLYKDNEKLQRKKSMMKMRNEEMEKKYQLTFIPTINNTQENVAKTNFFERQKHYVNSSKVNKENIKKQIEEKVVTECTFTPQLCKTIQCHYEQPACIRLYEDNARRIQNLKILDQMRMIELTGKTHHREKSNYSTEIRKTDDLYFDFKKKQDKLRKLKKLIDIEQGITFKPNVKSSSNIVVKSSFKERNNRVLEYKRLLNELGNSTPRYNSKKYTSSQIEENNKRIVERLYERDIEKIRSKNQRSNEKPPTYDTNENYSNLPIQELCRTNPFTSNDTEHLTFQLKSSEFDMDKLEEIEDNEEEMEQEEYDEEEDGNEEIMDYSSEMQKMRKNFKKEYM